MKKLLLLSVIVLVSASGYATDVKPYVEGRLTENWISGKFKENEYSKKFRNNALGRSLELGAKIDQFRIGLEGYYNDPLKDFLGGFPVKGETKGLFVNAYYDIPLGEQLKKIKPYVGVGIGYSWLKETLDATSVRLSAKDKDWGWNIGLGVGYALSDHIDLTLGYRYEDLGRIKDTYSKTDFENHKVSLGLRYTF